MTRVVGGNSQMQKTLKTTSTRKVGFYGCANEVVRVMCKVRPAKHYPQKVRLQCPSCGHEHDAIPAWRPYRPQLDDDKVPVYV